MAFKEIDKKNSALNVQPVSRYQKIKNTFILLGLPYVKDPLFVLHYRMKTFQLSEKF